MKTVHTLKMFLDQDFIDSDITEFELECKVCGKKLTYCEGESKTLDMIKKDKWHCDKEGFEVCDDCNTYLNELRVEQNKSMIKEVNSSIKANLE